MTARVAVVTDSTAYLPEGVREQYGVRVVPLHVTVGDRSGEEGRDVLPAHVAAALGGAAGAVSTSRPSPHRFAEVYTEASAASGGGAVVSVHLSGALSGTVEASRLGAREVPGIDVRVIDSGSTAMGLGFAVIAAGRAAAEGQAVDAVTAAARAAMASTTTLFYVDNLEHLRRGGRIGTAAALVGTALAVKPLLRVLDGTIVPVERVRTASRALTRLEDLAVASADDHVVDLAVHHLAAAERAADLANRLRGRLPRLAELYTSEVGAVVGAHVGPGSLGVVVHAR